MSVYALCELLRNDKQYDNTLVFSLFILSHAQSMSLLQVTSSTTSGIHAPAVCVVFFLIRQTHAQWCDWDHCFAIPKSAVDWQRLWPCPRTLGCTAQTILGGGRLYHRGHATQPLRRFVSDPGAPVKSWNGCGRKSNWGWHCRTVKVTLTR